jgi:hypothetical protein
MGLEITKKYFKYRYDNPSSYAFHALALNYFVKHVLSKRKDKTSTHLYFRLFRTGIIGDMLYKAGQIHVEELEHDVNNEVLAALFESYLALARSIYDYLLIFLKEQYGVKQESFNDFLKKVNKGEYKEIDKKFRDHLDNKIFADLRNLRDSVIHKTANLSIYVKDGEYRIEGTLYRDDKVNERIDESLYALMMKYTTSLLLLMSYITEKATGIGFKEQTKLLKLDID